MISLDYCNIFFFKGSFFKLKPLMGLSDLMGLSKLWAGCVWRKQRPIEEERTILGVKQHIYQMLPNMGVW